MASRIAVRMRIGPSLLPGVPSHSTALPLSRAVCLPPAAGVLASHAAARLSLPAPASRKSELRSTRPSGTARAAVMDLEPQTSPSEDSRKELGGGDEDKWQVKILYDGDCPICMKEVNFLTKRNENYGTLKFVDISADDYNPEENAGITFEDAMGHIHGINRDGSIVKGIEAFQRFYEVIGLGWVYAVTKLKPVQAVADAVYEVWAKYRLPLSGRPNLEALIEERRRAKLGEQTCSGNEDEECEVEY